MASVLLSTSVERFDVYSIRDFSPFFLFLDKSRFLFKFVSVPLSASVKRVGVFCMQDFLDPKSSQNGIIKGLIK